MLEPGNITPLANFISSPLDPYVKYVLELLHTWSQAISDPKQFLAPLFQPSDSQIVDGLEFYFPILVFSTLLYAPFVLGSKSEFADKIKLLAGSVVGLFLGLVATLSWHLAFWLLGGGANFAGTYLTSVYAGAPYVPLISISSLILYAALPSNLRPLALNPATAQQAMQRGLADPRTNNAAVVLGSLLVLSLVLWMTVVSFRCMSFVHSLSGWRLVVAIVLSLVIGGLVALLFQFIQSLFIPLPDETPPSIPPPSETFPPPNGMPGE